MILKNKNKTPDLYAKLYSKYKIIGTPYIPYRDMPNILNEHVIGKMAIDYGCGTGESSFFLKSLGFDVAGVDISEEMLLRVKNIDPTGEYIKINSGEMPFNKETYDLVFCSFVLLEISTKIELLEILQDISRVLKKGGIFIAIVANENTYHYEWLTLNTDFAENKALNSGQKVKIEFKDIGLTIFDYYWTQKDYKKIIESANLNLVKVYNPLGLDTDGYSWKDEKFAAPSSILVSKK